MNRVVYFAPHTATLDTGRTKELTPEVTEHCHSVARSLSLSAEFTFTDLKGKCHLV